jgi:hypothetical protein
VSQYHITKAYGRSGVKFQRIFILGTLDGEWLASRSYRFTSEEEQMVLAEQEAGWTRVDVVEKKVMASAGNRIADARHRV